MNVAISEVLGVMISLSVIFLIADVLEEFNKEQIIVIVLKGLVVRNYHPNAELRTIGEDDIIVNPKDIEKVCDLLKQLGYQEGSRDTKHIEFSKDGSSSIELHITLSSDRYFTNIPNFEKYIWVNAVNIKIGKSEVLSLSLEDLDLHLIVHVVNHMDGSGFRLLLDLVLLVEKGGNDIDWNRFMDKVIQCDIERFTCIIFEVCNRLFGMKIPIQFNVEIDGNIDIFIDEIFSRGVFRKIYVNKEIANIAVYNPNEQDKSKKSTSNIVDIVFPPNK